MKAEKSISAAGCRQCPRACGADRRGGVTGVCGMPETLYVSRIAPHLWEEPPISGRTGAGTIFFTGCNLRCVYCQNRDISQEKRGTPLTEDELARRILELASSGVHTIELVTPTHYTEEVARVLEKIKPRLSVPVVWNSGGYETVEALRRVEGLVDVYMPDFKYASSTLAGALSAAPDYPEVAAAALTEMYRQVGAARPEPSGEGDTSLLRRGVLVRHLVLPGCRRDSLAVLSRLATLLPPDGILLSLMSQYTPDFLDPSFALTPAVQEKLAAEGIRPALHRRLTDFEYRSVLDEADRLGFVGYRQGRASAQVAFKPEFGDGQI